MHIPSGDDEKGTGLEEEFYGERTVFRLPPVQHGRKLDLDALNANLVFYVPNFERRLLRVTQNLIQSGEDFYVQNSRLMAWRAERGARNEDAA